MAIQFSDVERVMTAVSALSSTLRKNQIGMTTDTYELGGMLPDGVTIKYYAPKDTNTSLGTSDVLTPTQKAVKTYVDNEISAFSAAENLWDRSGTDTIMKNTGDSLAVGIISATDAKAEIRDTSTQLKLSHSGTENLTVSVDTSGNTLISATGENITFAANVGIKNDTFPTSAIAEQIFIGSKDIAGGGASLALMLEEAVSGIGTFTPSHKIKVNINGAEYWIQLDAV